MDNGLVQLSQSKRDAEKNVLILVVVEDGLVLIKISFIKAVLRSLNPCCSGQWSRTRESVMRIECNSGLNPCCSGQ